jgi:AraC-like DNA-binding protein/quercetin dioxygenase-like cupin family protein
MPTRHSTEAAEGIGPVTPHLYVPTTQRPLRAKQRHLSTAQRVVPHRHPWAQLAFSTTGVIRLTTDQGTYLVPPSRAVWVPPGIEHAVTVVEDATLRTLYLHQPPGRCGPGVRAADDAAWRACRVLEVSDLLRALVVALDTTPDDAVSVPDAATLQRERLIGPLLQDELRRARPLPIGIDLPHDKRLRHLCEAVIAHPARHATLDDWARDVGASPRTLARLFREQLDTSFGQWRRQVLLAQALALAGRGRPMAQIATELGYASPSAFTAMFTRTVGAPPSRFFATVERQGAGA